LNFKEEKIIQLGVPGRLFEVFLRQFGVPGRQFGIIRRHLYLEDNI
jgi:hypothetical protein